MSLSKPVQSPLTHWEESANPEIKVVLKEILDLTDFVDERNLSFFFEGVIKILSPKLSYGKSKNVTARYRAKTENILHRREYPGCLLVNQNGEWRPGSGTHNENIWVDPVLTVSIRMGRAATIPSNQLFDILNKNTSNMSRKLVANAVCKILALSAAVTKDVTSMLYPRAVIRGDNEERHNALRRSNLVQNCLQGVNYSGAILRLVPQSCVAFHVQVGKYISLIKRLRGDISTGCKKDGHALSRAMGESNFQKLFGSVDKPYFADNWPVLNRIVNAIALEDTRSARQIPMLSPVALNVAVKSTHDFFVDGNGSKYIEMLRTGNIGVLINALDVKRYHAIGNIPTNVLVRLREAGILDFTFEEMREYTAKWSNMSEIESANWDRSSATGPTCTMKITHVVFLSQGSGKREGVAQAGNSASIRRTTERGLKMAKDLMRPIETNQTQAELGTAHEVAKWNGKIVNYVMKPKMWNGSRIKSSKEKRKALTANEKIAIAAKRQDKRSKPIQRFLPKAFVDEDPVFVPPTSKPQPSTSHAPSASAPMEAVNSLMPTPLSAANATSVFGTPPAPTKPSPRDILHSLNSDTVLQLDAEWGRLKDASAFDTQIARTYGVSKLEATTWRLVQKSYDNSLFDDSVQMIIGS